MKEFIYDNTFEGLLTAIFYSYSQSSKCYITKEKDYIPSLLNEIIHIKTEEDKFERVYDSILNKLSKDILQNVYLVYLSDIAGSDTLILNYLKLCYKYGSSINLAKNNDIIILIDKYKRKVSHEAHILSGFIRFKEIGPLTFYSSIEPDHNILPILINHFTKRFSDQNFIIHDLKRETALVYNKESAIIINFTKSQAEDFIKSDSDKEFENLWSVFYKATDIEERKNLRLQRQMMPKRYWKHIFETQKN
ncbi:probable DNA metabolism protein [Clostridium sp. DSM 8431]|uniref:TIGR03915 family putative DNA repair protein n=1 Tax=Clostridium sp. DSM 8431 TaxID=1761781 RepID=UPI0008ED7952|nr:TIGR03915 family putative DNA repair protein [Clostridium sp. DSM 8431]SFU81453.1 probable DNA metabolism protein [Clostridium sp. DSM 8431]